MMPLLVPNASYGARSAEYDFIGTARNYPCGRTTRLRRGRGAAAPKRVSSSPGFRPGAATLLVGNTARLGGPGRAPLVFFCREDHGVDRGRQPLGGGHHLVRGRRAEPRLEGDDAGKGERERRRRNRPRERKREHPSSRRRRPRRPPAAASGRARLEWRKRRPVRRRRRAGRVGSLAHASQRRHRGDRGAGRGGETAVEDVSGGG